jgi:hypothetical protein
LYKWAQSKGAALAQAVMQDVFTAITKSVFTNTVTVSPSTMNYNAVVSASIKADTICMPINQRSLVLNPTYHAALRTDANVANAFNYGNMGTTAPIQSSNIPMIDGCPVYKSNVVPATDNIVGFLASPQAVLFVNRACNAQDQEGTMTVKTFSDTTHGFTITQKEYYTPSRGSRTLLYEIEYGYKVGNPSGSVLLTT